ncbi:hypothetical protein MUP37_00760, partial [Candidatus Bathyarchaeota archaeon]|nr:hypothetical protein [Candidatus Bathyarchaeota archaeon]
MLTEQMAGAIGILYALELNADILQINLITTVGLGMVIDLMHAGGPTDGKIRYMAVGSDATAPALAQT